MVCTVSTFRKTKGKGGTGLQLIIAYRYSSCRLPLQRQETEKEHFICILFTLLKTYKEECKFWGFHGDDYEEKFPEMAKMTKNTLKSSKVYRKNYPQTEKMTYNTRSYIYVTSSSSPGFTGIA
jgi:hypothetical protein